MDLIYNCSPNDLVSIKGQLTTFQSELKLDDDIPLPKNSDDIKNLLGIDNEEEFDELVKSVDLVEHLSHPDDVRVLQYKPGHEQQRKAVVEIPKRALHLNTFRDVVTFKKQFVGNAFGPSGLNNKQIDTLYSEVRNLDPYEDVLISIRFYRPFRSVEIGAVAGPNFAEEFVVRGQQFLSELRDKVPCECSNKPLYDVSENPKQQAPELDSDSGFFFITDTFYNDMRNPKNHDYSNVIRKWAKSRKEGTFSSTFKTARMEETKFIDLNVRIGFPQVYQHFGNCEHLFTFSWIRILQPDDHLFTGDYPMLRSMEFNHTVYCNMCDVRKYSFIVTNSDRHVHNPAYLCCSCFNSFHYVDGKKVGEFQAYYQNPDDGGDMFVPSSDEDEIDLMVEMED